MLRKAFVILCSFILVNYPWIDLNRSQVFTLRLYMIVKLPGLLLSRSAARVRRECCPAVPDVPGAVCGHVHLQHGVPALVHLAVLHPPRLRRLVPSGLQGCNILHCPLRNIK